MSEKTRQQRRAETAQMPKCFCGDVIPMVNQKKGIEKCHRHHDEDVEAAAATLAEERRLHREARLRQELMDATTLDELKAVLLEIHYPD